MIQQVVTPLYFFAISENNLQEHPHPLYPSTTHWKTCAPFAIPHTAICAPPTDDVVPNTHVPVVTSSQSSYPLSQGLRCWSSNQHENFWTIHLSLPVAECHQIVENSHTIANFWTMTECLLYNIVYSYEWVSYVLVWWSHDKRLLGKRINISGSARTGWWQPIMSSRMVGLLRYARSNPTSL